MQMTLIVRAISIPKGAIMSEYYEIIAEEEIKSERLYKELKRVFIPCSIDDDGDLLIQDQITAFIFINHQYLKFLSRFTLKDDVTEEQKIAFCHRANHDYIFSRFSYRENYIFVEYFLNTQGGLALHNFIYTLRFFMSTTRNIIVDADTEDIIK